jgi:hypothetical protein
MVKGNKTTPMMIGAWNGIDCINDGTKCIIDAVVGVVRPQLPKRLVAPTQADEGCEFGANMMCSNESSAMEFDPLQIEQRGPWLVATRVCFLERDQKWLVTFIIDRCVLYSNSLSSFALGVRFQRALC